MIIEMSLNSNEVLYCDVCRTAITCCDNVVIQNLDRGITVMCQRCYEEHDASWD